MSLALYSPEDVVILLGGIVPIEGLAEGSFISISKSGEQYKTTTTADGRVSRVKNEDPTHTVTLTLHSTADANLILSGLASTDHIVNSVVIPLFIKDGLGTTMFYAPSFWIEQLPERVFSEGVEANQWTLRTAGAQMVVGGNESGGLVDANLAALGFIAADFAGLF